MEFLLNGHEGIIVNFIKKVKLYKVRNLISVGVVF